MHLAVIVLLITLGDWRPLSICKWKAETHRRRGNLMLNIHRDFVESNLNAMHFARPQGPVIMEELMIKYIENPENSFRKLERRTYPWLCGRISGAELGLQQEWKKTPLRHCPGLRTWTAGPLNPSLRAADETSAQISELDVFCFRCSRGLSLIVTLRNPLKLFEPVSSPAKQG